MDSVQFRMEMKEEEQDLSFMDRYQSNVRIKVDQDQYRQEVMKPKLDPDFVDQCHCEAGEPELFTSEPLHQRH